MNTAARVYVILYIFRVYSQYQTEESVEAAETKRTGSKSMTSISGGSFTKIPSFYFMSEPPSTRTGNAILEVHLSVVMNRLLMYNSCFGVREFRDCLGRTTDSVLSKVRSFSKPRYNTNRSTVEPLVISPRETYPRYRDQLYTRQHRH